MPTYKETRNKEATEKLLRRRLKSKDYGRFLFVRARFSGYRLVSLQRVRMSGASSERGFLYYVSSTGGLHLVRGQHGLSYRQKRLTSYDLGGFKYKGPAKQFVETRFYQSSRPKRPKNLPKGSVWNPNALFEGWRTVKGGDIWIKFRKDVADIVLKARASFYTFNMEFAAKLGKSYRYLRFSESLEIPNDLESTKTRTVRDQIYSKLWEIYWHAVEQVHGAFDQKEWATKGSSDFVGDLDKNRQKNGRRKPRSQWRTRVDRFNDLNGRWKRRGFKVVRIAKISYQLERYA